VAQLERRRSEDLERLAAVTRHAAYLASTDGAIRVLGLAAVHRLGIYDFARRQRPRIDRLLRPVSRPSSGPAPAEAQAAIASRPSLHEAIAVANALASGAHELALERLYALGALLGRVLCLGGTPRALAGAYMMAGGGAEVTLLGEKPPAGLRITGLHPDERSLGRLLVDEPDVVLRAGAVLLDGEEDLPLLAARLGPDACVLALGAIPAALADVPHATDVPGLASFETPPAAWVRRGRRPATLPSGRPWPRITIVTVSYNHAAFLEDTLRSVLDQDYPELEYIVIDGGSQDGTAEILDRYRDRLAYCESAPDRGQSHALNKGFARATGSILAWLNSDDRYAPEALWRAALAFDLYGADLVSGGCALAEEPHGRVARVHHSALPIGRAVPLRSDQLLDLDGSWLRGDFFFQPEVFWTRDLWQRAGGRVAEELHYSMDYELWVRFALAGARIVHVPDTLALYRVHPGQKTAGDDLPYLPELRRVAASFRPVEA
jgi:GT2 family glycosyltransferase